MKSRFIVSALSLLLTATVLLAGAQSALADTTDTTAGTTVSNIATLSYTLSGGGSFDLKSSPGGNSDPTGPGASTSFTVDHKVRPYVQVATGSPASPTDVFAGGTVQVISFNVKNDGNKDGDFKITYNQVALANNIIDSTSVTMVYKTSANAVYDGSELAMPAGDVLSIPRDLTYTVFIVANTVADTSLLTEGDKQNFDLLAQAWSGAAALSETGSNTPTLQDVVFADDTGTAVSDTGGIDKTPSDPDGIHSDQGTYNFRNVAVTVSKTESILYDPYGLSYYLPGVYVQYEITIENTSLGATSAFLTSINDVITQSATDAFVFDPDHVDSSKNIVGHNAGESIYVDLSGTGRSAAGHWLTGNSSDGDAASLTAGDPNSTLTVDFDAGPSTILLPTEAGYLEGELKQGESIIITYNVQISGIDVSTASTSIP